MELLRLVVEVGVAATSRRTSFPEDKVRAFALRIRDDSSEAEEDNDLEEWEVGGGLEFAEGDSADGEAASSKILKPHE